MQEKSKDFRLFCAQQSLEHERLGLTGYSSITSLGGLLWYGTAWRRFSGLGDKRPAPAPGAPAAVSLSALGKRARREVAEAAAPEDPLQLLAAEFARSLRRSIGQQDSVEGLRRAAAEPFPKPQSAAEETLLLTAFEIQMRLFFRDPGDEVLATMKEMCLGQFSELYEMGAIYYRSSGYPSLCLLFELHHVWKSVQSWAGRSLGERRAVIASIQRALGRCHSATAEPVLERITQVVRRASSEAELFGSAEEQATLLADISLLARCVPYQFPTTGDVLVQAGAGAPGPDGVLVLDSDSDDDATQDDDDDALVADIVAGRPPKAAGRPPVLDQPSAPAAAAPPGRATTAPRALPRDAVVCRSKYHAMYSDVNKHGSRRCQFCNVCHMLEILFNGCKHDCAWHHWPSERKIATNFGRNPAVARLARTRLAAMKGGETLLPSNELPI